jgi:hypothetical protein
MDEDTEVLKRIALIRGFSLRWFWVSGAKPTVAKYDSTGEPSCTTT